MIRFEAWMLLPFLSVLLIRQPKRAAVFLAVALIHPAFWMIGNALAYGDPLFGFAAITSWRVEVTGRQPVADFSWMAQRIWQLLEMTAIGLTVPVCLLITAGVIRSLLNRRVEAVWLIPPFGLFLLFAAAAAQGSLLMRAS